MYRRLQSSGKMITFSNHRKDIAALKNHITARRKGITARRKDIAALKNHVAAHRKDIAALKNHITARRKGIAARRKDIAALKNCKKKGTPINEVPKFGLGFYKNRKKKFMNY